MHIKRMKETIKLLRNPPKSVKWDYLVWVNEPITYDGTSHPCGTIACAAGLMCLHPPFQKAGLVFIKGAPTYKKYSFDDALECFLGIKTEEIYTAFISLHRLYRITPDEVTPTHVADYLQGLLDKELSNATHSP